MAKITAWLVTLVGVLLLFDALGLLSVGDLLVKWIIALAVLVVGIGKLSRNYKKKKKR